MEQWETDPNNHGPEAPILKVPAGPSNREWEEHQVTHTPPKPGCKYCTMGRGIRRMHRRNVDDIEPVENGIHKISMGYMYLNDRQEEGEQPNLVMVDHNNERAFAYAVPRKGAWGEAS